MVIRTLAAMTNRRLHARRPRVSRTVVAFALAASLVGWLSGPASASAQVRDLSNADPAGSVCATGEETEPTVAVDPADRDNLAAAWTQGRDGGSEIVVAASSDHGNSWTQAVVPGVEDGRCDGTGTAASNPSVSFGAAGLLYLGVYQYTPGQDDGHQLVLTSDRGGRPGSWSEPVDLGRGNRGRIVADPVVAGRAYFIHLISSAQDLAESVEAQRTNDGAATWTSPVVVYSGALGGAVQPDLAITGRRSDGTARLMAVFHGGYDANLCCTYTIVSHSPDGGASWTPPEQVAETSNTYPFDPDTGRAVADVTVGQGPSIAAAPDGRVYLAWADTDPSRYPLTPPPHAGQIHVAAAPSDTPGVAWSDVVVNAATAPTSEAFEPRVAVGADGTVAVEYYDDRHDLGGDGAWTGDAWVGVSHDLGSSWADAHVAGPFDLRASGGYFTDTVSLASSGNAFVAGFDIGPPASLANGFEGTTDVCVARIRP